MSLQHFTSAVEASPYLICLLASIDADSLLFCWQITLWSVWSLWSGQYVQCRWTHADHSYWFDSTDW